MIPDPIPTIPIVGVHKRSKRTISRCMEFQTHMDTLVPEEEGKSERYIYVPMRR